MNVSCQDEQLSSKASIFLSLWFSLSGLAAVTGNVVVLWLFYKSESLRTTSNRFLASLSVADLLVGLVVDPASVAIRCLTQPRESDILNKVMDMLWIHTTSATTVQRVLCFSRPVHCDTLSFPLSGHFNQENESYDNHFGMANFTISTIYIDFER